MKFCKGLSFPQIPVFEVPLCIRHPVTLSEVPGISSEQVAGVFFSLQLHWSRQDGQKPKE